MASIFARQSLTASQLRTVAQRRFDDARALCDTDRNIHANGAQYLCGFVVEMLLKAQLIETYPGIANIKPHDARAAHEREIWSLIYRSHDLDEMLARLPQVRVSVEKRSGRDGRPYTRYLTQICESWTIFARYSTLSTMIAEARQFLERVRDLKEVLK
jgi:hypothetical protein